MAQRKAKETNKNQGLNKPLARSKHPQTKLITLYEKAIWTDRDDEAIHRIFCTTDIGGYLAYTLHHPYQTISLL